MVAAAAAGCIDQSPVSPSASALIVQAVLDAAATDQYVIVQSTSGAVLQQTPVKGAQVTLTLPGGRVMTAAEEEDSTIVSTRSIEPAVTTIYHFALGAAGVALVPGGMYQLRVIVPDGRVVSGSTTIPTALAARDVAPVRTFDHAKDTLSLDWPQVAGASSYEVLVRSSRSVFAVFTGTSIMLTGKSTFDGTSAFITGLTHQLIVSAVDGNYYDYYRQNSGPFTAVGVINHLQGGIGVFGSIVEIERLAIAVH